MKFTFIDFFYRFFCLVNFSWWFRRFLKQLASLAFKYYPIVILSPKGVKLRQSISRWQSSQIGLFPRFYVLFSHCQSYHKWDWILAKWTKLYMCASKARTFSFLKVTKLRPFSPTFFCPVFCNDKNWFLHGIFGFLQVKVACLSSIYV